MAVTVVTKNTPSGIKIDSTTYTCGVIDNVNLDNINKLLWR